MHVFAKMQKVISFWFFLCVCFCLLGGTPSAWAEPSIGMGVCKAPSSATTYHRRESFYSDALDVYMATVEGMPIVTGASQPFPIDFPVAGGVVQFFYMALKGELAVENGETLLVGCLHFRGLGEEMHTLELEQPTNGNDGVAIVHGVFAASINKGIGQTLFLIVRWPTHSFDMDGDLYQVFVYKSKKGDSDHWVLDELGELENAIDNSDGFEGSRSGNKVTYPYKTRGQIFSRLRALGYQVN